MPFLRRQQLIATCFALLLAACGKAGEERATQVAAKVNGDEITVHQVNQAIQRLGNVPESQAKQAQKQILDRLVDQQLLVQQAVHKKLDRHPRVMAALDAARREILAQAYVEQVVGNVQKATADQVKQYYAQHPELFHERRVYRFAQMAVPVPADQQEAVRAKLGDLDKLADKQKILPQLADWLKAQNLQFRVTQTTQAAEQLPLEALPRYHQMKVGDLLFLPGPQGVLVSQLVAYQSQPLSEEQAQPVIEQYLHNRERLKLSDEEMKRLRVAAKIEYLGAFAKLEGEASPSAKASAGDEPPAAQRPTAVTQSTEPAPDNQGNIDPDALAKGVKALK